MSIQSPATGKNARESVVTDVAVSFRESACAVPVRSNTSGRCRPRSLPSPSTEYWIVNLRAKIVEVYRDPRSDEYGSREDFSPGSSVVLAAGDATVTVEVDALLP